MLIFSWDTSGENYETTEQPKATEKALWAKAVQRSRSLPKHKRESPTQHTHIESSEASGKRFLLAAKVRIYPEKQKGSTMASLSHPIKYELNQ